MDKVTSPPRHPQRPPVPHWPQPAQPAQPAQQTGQVTPILPHNIYTPPQPNVQPARQSDQVNPVLPHDLYTPPQPDVPPPTSTPRSTPSPRSSFAFAESAAFLLLFSAFIFIEGGIRFISSRQEFDFPVAVIYAASGCELTFGLLGTLLALSALLSRVFNPQQLKVVIFVQIILSIFTFVVYNIARPILHIIDFTSVLPSLPSFGDDTFRVKAIFAALTAANFSLALFGGQLLFMTRLLSAETGHDSWRAQSGNRMRAVLWNLNFFLAGLWTLIFGIFALIDNDGNVVIGFFGLFFFPPHIGNKPGLTTAAGAVMMLWAATGIMVIGQRLRNITWYLIVSILVAVFVYLNFTLVQFFTVDAGLGFGGFLTLNTIHVFATIFLAVYYVCQATVREVREGRDREL